MHTVAIVDQCVSKYLAQYFTISLCFDAALVVFSPNSEVVRISQEMCFSIPFRDNNCQAAIYMYVW